MKFAYGLGIDAGGTYTDAVILDFSTGNVMESSKAPTTQPDPSEGINAALARLDPALLQKVSLASLATTFATNAIVEDRGAEAGLILVGYDECPADIDRETRVLMINGGHNVTGEEKAPLDVRSLEDRLADFLKDLEAVAVAGFFSVRNPEHEIKVAQVIRDRYDLPVVRGHRLSMRLDAVKRATTALWNARLIPLISNLIKATKEVLSQNGINVPLMVVRGDGTLMSARTALDRPVDTLLSGPASSISGAKHLSGLRDALIVDMGGTTTDMAVLSEGKVAIDPRGAQVGKWKTHVEAARVRTIGLGGDSLISTNFDGLLVVGPRRVVPLCVFAEQHPEIIQILRKILILPNKVPCGRVNPCTFYFKNRSANDPDDSTAKEYSASGLVNEYLQFKNAGDWFSPRQNEHAENMGLVVRSSLTPTDIRVAAGHFNLGSREAARLGLAVFAEHLGIKESEFMEAVEEAITKKLCLEAINFIDDQHNGPLSRLIDRWFKAPCSRAGGVDLNIQVSLTAPVIAAGAPAPLCLPRTFSRLNSQCILPEAYEVSVAVGAIIGMVDRTLTATIRKNESGRIILHTQLGKNEFDTMAEALNTAQNQLETFARQIMRKDHISDPLLDYKIEEKTAKAAGGEEIHLETQLTLRATGRPAVWQKA
jgi:N-methylhydantoinase A/oxoprolinase/acetone carboxylase beta subunit